MSLDIPMLAGTAWIVPIFASVVVLMIFKWLIDILP